MAGEKTEKATPKKRKDERKKGNVFLSKDAVTAVSLIASFYALKVFAPTIFSSTQATVGFEILEYICPSASRSKSLPIASLVSFLNVVL